MTGLVDIRRRMQIEMNSLGVHSLRPGLAGIATPQSGRLNLRIQKQMLDNWCWAAIASSIAKFRGKGDFPLCQVASGVLGKPTCCRAPAQCNELARLETALTLMGVYRGKIAGPPSFDVIRSEIAAGRPICIRVIPVLRLPHFTTIVGYSVLGGRPMLHLSDSHGLFSGAGFAYRPFPPNGGQWTDSYFIL